MVSLTAYFVTPKLDPNKIHLDCCAGHGQLYHTGYMTEWYETQMGLHVVSNGGSKHSQ